MLLLRVPQTYSVKEIKLPTSDELKQALSRVSSSLNCLQLV